MFKFLEAKWQFHPLLKFLSMLGMIVVLPLAGPIGIGIILILSFLLFHRNQKKKQLLGVFFTVLLLVIHIFCGKLGLFVTILTIFWYIDLILITSSKKDFCYFYEKFCYQSRNKKRTQQFLMLLYGPSFFQEEVSFLRERRKMLGSILTMRIFFYHLEEAFRRVKLRLTKINQVYTLRLYQNRKERTYLNDHYWDIDDNTYLMIHLCLFAICLIR